MEINDKVVCVPVTQKNGVTFYNPDVFEVRGSMPTVGLVYTVRGETPPDANGVIGLLLVGSVCIHKPTGQESGWDSKGFRKLEECREENRQKQHNIN